MRVLADVLAPGIVGVGADAMDRADAVPPLEALEHVEYEKEMNSMT